MMSRIYFFKPRAPFCHRAIVTYSVSKRPFYMLYAPLIYAPDGFVKTSFKKEGQAFLDVGCGFRKLPGAVGVDANRNSEADVHHNLESFPWPFAENSFDLILLSHVLEHLPDTARTLRAIWRVG